MAAMSMYRGNLHRGGVEAERRWPSPRPTLSAARFRRRLRSRSHAVARLAQAGSPSSSPTSRLAADGAAEPAGQAEEVGEEEEQQQQQGQDEEEEEEDEQEEGAVEDVDMDVAGEVVVGGDDADGNGDAEGGQSESEGFDPNPEASYLDGIEERKRELNDKLDTLNKKKHDLVQMLKQALNAEEEIRMHSMQASLRATMPQPSKKCS